MEAEDEFTGLYVGLAKVYIDDLIKSGQKRSRGGVYQGIRDGTIPPPHKQGAGRNATIFWYPSELRNAARREQQRIRQLSAA